MLMAEICSPDVSAKRRKSQTLQCNLKRRFISVYIGIVPDAAASNPTGRIYLLEICCGLLACLATQHRPRRLLAVNIDTVCCRHHRCRRYRRNAGAEWRSVFPEGQLLPQQFRSGARHEPSCYLRLLRELFFWPAHAARPAAEAAGGFLAGWQRLRLFWIFKNQLQRC